MTQIKASLQVSYDLDQSNTVTYNYIANILKVEATSLGYHTPPRIQWHQHLWKESTRERHQGSRWINIQQVLPKLV